MSSADVATEGLIRPAAHAAAATGLRTRVLDTLADAKADWQALERRGIVTPYQRYDWIAHWLAAHGAPDRLAIVVIEDGEKPVALLPLELERRHGLMRAAIVGSDIGNSDWLLHDPAAAPLLTPAALQAMLRQVAGRLGIDYLQLGNMPPHWQGHANPLLAFPHQPASDNLFVADLGAVELPKKRRVDILRGRRRLEESFGPIALRRAATPDEVDAAHAAFLAHRTTRFAEMGVENIFARPDFVAFFRDTAIDSLGQERPALCFHTLHAGDEIVATACGTYTADHYSQYINSNTSGPAARYSLMGLLMYELTQELAAQGIRSLDMGVGNFTYKAAWTAPEEVYDGIVPLSLAGSLAAPLLRAAGRAKRAIKANPALFGLFRHTRLHLRRLLGRSQ